MTTVKVVVVVLMLVREVMRIEKRSEKYGDRKENFDIGY